MLLSLVRFMSLRLEILYAIELGTILHHSVWYDFMP